MERADGGDGLGVLAEFRLGKGQAGDGAWARSEIAEISAPATTAALMQVARVLGREPGFNRIFRCVGVKFLVQRGNIDESASVIARKRGVE